jgi:co-chaperonin GroES (HSP10)
LKTASIETLQALGRSPEVVEPFGNYLTIRLFKPNDTSKGGIVLPENVRDNDKQMLAEVISTGKGQRNLLTGEYMGCLCGPGDLVIIMKHAPVEIKVGGESFHVIFEGDVIGKVDRDALKERAGVEI